ncbi:MAG: O-antigen ligase family protein [Chloroflexota bacterium]
MTPRRVRLAVLLACICHGLFILTGRYRLSYDAYTHMLFANHYAENWFSLWETRWYTGFTVVSYPPLAHQLIALFIPLLGFDKAFALILWVVTTLYPLGIYAFSRIFTGKTSASYAALASAILLPIYVSAHIFGQLPFITSTLTALFAAASLNRYLREGGVHNFALSVALVTTSMALHHATLMVHPFFIFAIITNNVLRSEQSGAQSKSRYVYRLCLFIIIAIITSLLAILPFWQWGADQIIQTPIDHLSRHNFFTDPLAPVIFFFPLYGPLLAVIPFLFRKWHPRFTGLLLSFTALFLLGLGGTTPLPSLFFGKAWEWLTYDRFAFWACLILTPFFGILFIGLKKKLRFITKPLPAALRKSLISALTFSFFTATVLGAWLMPLAFPLEPKTIAMEPIVAFLNSGDNSQWRYLTFGFGDQFAYLNLLTKATTIDGSYHTARTLPELRESGIGQIDTSYWALNGMTAIVPILEKSGEHGVRWGFVNPATLEAVKIHWGAVHQSPFVPLLNELGWKKIKTLDNGVLVYENPNALPLVPSEAPTTPPINSFIWGVFPMLAFITASALGTLRAYPIQAEWVIRKIYAFAISLLPITLCFWIYRTIADFSHPRVYFTYDNALFFLGDAFAVVAVTLWLSVKISHSSFVFQLSSYQTNSRLSISKFILDPLAFFFLLFALCVLITLSTLWSQDWRTSLYISLHFWLIFLLILSLRDWHATWTVTLFGLCAALSIQLITGFIGFALQSTAFLDTLNMKWPGVLDPSMRGASVVELPSGETFLRAYGTLPHPNILGGFAFILLLGPIALFFDREKPNYLALLLIAPGIALLALTFSRSAWLALIAFAFILILKSKYFNRKQLSLFLIIGVLSFALTLLPYRQLVQARTTNTTSHSEAFSLIGRAWLSQEALQMLRERPLTGVGIGSFIITLSQRAGAGYIIEPVHSIFLLAGSELGLGGLLLVATLFISIALNIFKSQTPQAILTSATLTGLGVIGLFDHYLWTIAPGRIMLGLALGLWAGQVTYDA